MIPALTSAAPPKDLYRQFIDALSACGFAGEIGSDSANRTVLATDNSIYQMLPQAVLYPKTIDDLQKIAQLCSRESFRQIVLSPRGGGTGTNGQSLTEGLVVDLSKHMNAILEINQAERWVRVQTGVVKDQLNAALRPFGLFFAPELSTSNRATIGGMINTDASGQGSCLYGKTRDHVLALKTVLMDGTLLESSPLSEQDFSQRAREQNRIGEIHRLAQEIATDYGAEIAKTFPKLNRCLTGYDLAHIRTPKGEFDLNSLLCGSEGTLGFVVEATLNVLPIPKHSCLYVVKYSDFQSALQDAARLMKAQPTSIETVDSKVLNLAMNDIVWHEVAEFFPESAVPVQGVNLVEFSADSELALKEAAARLNHVLESAANADCLGHTLAWGDTQVKRLWGMRKKAVGLLGNSQGEARPIPFVEDTAVPPEHLADFIAEFRRLLDDHALQYGMFGHVDAGVLHVRPAIDMKDPEQAKLVRVISDKVAALTRKYGGLLWGEHGKGVRSEYAPEVFAGLYPQLQRIKAAFDPYNQLNPGKIATPSDQLQLLRIDEVPTRGESDRAIFAHVWQGFSEAVHCNGNGACFNWDLNDAMCPSWKATRERIHSPKGRASLLREWLTQLQKEGVDTLALLETPRGIGQGLKQFWGKWANSRAKKRGEYDFSNEVFTAMAGCLACKSCAGQCPVKVDVPTFRSKFLALYYTRYLRPPKDYLVGSLEFVLPWAARMPKLYNKMMGAKWVKRGLSRFVGFEDAPLLSTTKFAELAQRIQVPVASQALIENFSDAKRKTSVIIVQDAFTSFFDAEMVADICRLLKLLGFTPMLAPYHPNGKPLHVQGFVQKFEKTAARNARKLKALEQLGVPLVGIDPAMTLTYRLEYAKCIAKADLPNVQLLQEWLVEFVDVLRKKQPLLTANGRFKLLPHCTEQTNAAASMACWSEVFSALGQHLEIAKVGCCGMSGTYGHESTNRETSGVIFQQSWKHAVLARDFHGKTGATGYSCRSQASREAFVKLPHPLQLLYQQRVATTD